MEAEEAVEVRLLEILLALVHRTFCSDINSSRNRTRTRTGRGILVWGFLDLSGRGGDRSIDDGEDMEREVGR